MAHYSHSFVAKYGLSVSAAEDSTTNANYFPLFGTQSVGVLAIKASSTKLSFNPSTGLLSATALAGNGALVTNLSAANVAAGTLPVARGGTGVTSSTGTGNVVLSTSATLTTPTLSTPTLTTPTSTGGTFTSPVIWSSAINSPTIDSPVIQGTVNMRSNVLELGLLSTATAAIIDFHSSGQNIDYDARLYSSGGNGTSGQAQMVFQAASGFNFNASIYTSGDVTAFSDIRLKKNIKPIKGALARVLGWFGVTYEMKEDGRASRGVIAQNIRATAPELVIEDPVTKMLAVNYAQMAGDFIEAIRELNNKIETLEAKVKDLESK